MVSCQGDFSAKSLRDFALRAPLEMTYIGNIVSIALTASDISILSREMPTLPLNPTLSTRTDRGGTPIALTASDISILSRVNDEVTGESEVKYAN